MGSSLSVPTMMALELSYNKPGRQLVVNEWVFLFFSRNGFQEFEGIRHVEDASIAPS